MSGVWEYSPKSVRGAHDPVVALALWSLVGAAAGGALLSLPFNYSMADMLPVLGGVVFLLGSYFAARTLRDNEIVQATKMLEAETQAVRIAGVYRLGTVAAAVPRFRWYGMAALHGLVAEEEDGQPARRLAEEVIDQLTALDKWEIGVLQVGV